jgi:hypothetical protein
MLARHIIAQVLQNTRRIHIDKYVWTIIDGYLSGVLNNLAVKAPVCDSITSNFRHKKLLYTKEQVNVLKKALGNDFGVGCSSPCPLVSLTNNVESNHMCESCVVDDNTYLNSV